MAGKPVASEGAANSVQGPQGGLCQATSGTAVSFDLTSWAGRYVKLTCETTDCFYLCAATTGATIDETATASSAASADATIPQLLAAGQSTDFLVDLAYPFLRVKTGGTAGKARVTRS